MPNYVKLIIGISVSVIIALLVLLGFKMYENYNMQKQIVENIITQKQLEDFIARNSSSFVSKKDFEAFAKQRDLDLSTIRKDVAKYGGVVKAIQDVVTESKKTVCVNCPGEIVPNPEDKPITPNPPPSDINKYKPDVNRWYERTARLKLNETFIGKDPNGLDVAVVVPFGSVDFTAAAIPGKEWSYNIYGRTYSTNTIVAENANREKIVTYNSVTIKTSDGKLYKVPASGDTVQLFPKASFAWNPELYLGIGGGVVFGNLTSGEAVGNLSLGLFSYGKYKVNPEVSLLQVGAAYGAASREVFVTVTPIAVNVAPVLPILKNTYISGSVGISTTGNALGTIDLKVSL
jgi:hypothetical protein